VFVFAVAGVVSTGNAPVDGGLAALKVAAKILPAIKGGSKIVGDAIEQAMLQGFTSMNLERLLKLPGIARLAEKISSRNAYQAYERMLHNRASVENLARYVDEAKLVDGTGETALIYVERMAGKYPTTKFDWVRNPEQFFHAWTDHPEMWKNLGITSEAQLQNMLEEVVRNGRKVIYRQPVPGGFEDNFGFYDEARNIFVAAKEDGRLWTAFRPGNNWWNPGEGLKYVTENLKWSLTIK